MAPSKRRTIVDNVILILRLTPIATGPIIEQLTGTKKATKLVAMRHTYYYRPALCHRYQDESHIESLCNLQLPQQSKPCQPEQGPFFSIFRLPQN